MLKLKQITPEQLAAEIEASHRKTSRASRDRAVIRPRAWPLFARDENWVAGGSGLASPTAPVWVIMGLAARDTRDVYVPNRHPPRRLSLLPILPYSDFAHLGQPGAEIHLGSYGNRPNGSISPRHGPTQLQMKRSTTSARRSPSICGTPDDGDHPREAPSDGVWIPDCGCQSSTAICYGLSQPQSYRAACRRFGAKVNGLPKFSPAVLHDGILVASWKTTLKGQRTDVEVTTCSIRIPC